MINIYYHWKKGDTDYNYPYVLLQSCSLDFVKWVMKKRKTFPYIEKLYKDKLLPVYLQDYLKFLKETKCEI